jgi:rfaE bifunctional protein kinase chain/domain
MLRLDAEMTTDINMAEEDMLLHSFASFVNLENPSVVIFEDYNKGVLTERVIGEMTNLCIAKGIVTTVDPKRKNFFCYHGISIFKPNLKEVKEGLNVLLDDVDELMLRDIHDQLNKRINHSISLITLSDKGVFYQHENQSAMLPSYVRSIADVSGAGDTVIAVASVIYACTKDVHLTAAVANVAAGLVCEEVGTVAINKESLLKQCSSLLPGLLPALA